jgi:3-phenylpropionate/trans-cinnamate dioxygenase alpha subunit
MTDRLPDADAPLEDLVDWERGLVSGHLFADEGIYRAELERVFLRTWLFLAHESQLDRPGAFVTTSMGTDPVLVVRQSDGSIRAMLNACRHRGMAVCRADSGTARAFTCPFHGWSYERDGALVNVPNLDSGYQGELDRSAWGLVPVARVETYKGLVFGCFDPEVPPLIEYLGDMAWYLDCLLDRREGGTEAIGGIHKIRMHGNWKLVSEQFAGDNYHAGLTHASAMQSWLPPGTEGPRNFQSAMSAAGRQFTCRQGHGTAGFFLSERALTGALRTMGRDHQLVADYYEATDAEVVNRLGAERAKGPSSTAGCVFPTFTYLAAVFGQSSIGVVHPRGPDHFDFWRLGIVDAAAPPEVKRATVRCLHVWPIGLADADDGENWSSVQTSLAGPMVRRLRFNYQMGAGHEGPDDTYPGIVTASPISENPQRAFYRRWLEFMTSEVWPHLR